MSSKGAIGKFSFEFCFKWPLPGHNLSRLFVVMGGNMGVISLNISNVVFDTYFLNLDMLLFHCSVLVLAKMAFTNSLMRK